MVSNNIIMGSVYSVKILRKEEEKMKKIIAIIPIDLTIITVIRERKYIISSEKAKTLYWRR